MTILNERVPKDLSENIEYRIRLDRITAGDRRAQACCMVFARENPTWWFNTFLWLFEPRPMETDAGIGLPHVIPFITWPHQDPALESLFANMGTADIGMIKSRGEGASWLVLMAFLHQWIYVPLSAFGLVSKDEKMTDSPDNPDSLMWKVDWEISRLPKWMVGAPEEDFSRRIATHSLRNLRNQSTIIGYSSTEDVARGGRKTAFLLDELAAFPRTGSPPADKAAMDSTQHVTECRILISTPQGPSGAYYESMTGDSDIVKIRLNWRDNPTKNRGLYKVADGKPVAVDESRYGPLPKRYNEEHWWERMRRRLQDKGYGIESRTRSPWYDKQCMRTNATPLSINQELEEDFGGSVMRFFSQGLIDRLLRETAKPPIAVGELSFEPEDLDHPVWSAKPQGQLRLWFDPGVRNKPPISVYAIGCDIAAGLGGVGGSNSTICIGDCTTGRKVAELASPRIRPEQLAEYAVAVANWFRGENGPAKLGWETNGYGNLFTARISEVNFRNLYYRPLSDAIVRKPTMKPGWHSRRDTKRALLGQYVHWLLTGKFINPSKESLDECLCYEAGPDGDVYHTGAKGCPDPSGAGDNHGDRVIGDAVLVEVMRSCGRGRTGDEPVRIVPQNSFAGRRSNWDRTRREALSKEASFSFS